MFKLLYTIFTNKHIYVYISFADSLKSLKSNSILNRNLYSIRHLNGVEFANINSGCLPLVALTYVQLYIKWIKTMLSQNLDQTDFLGVTLSYFQAVHD